MQERREFDPWVGKVPWRRTWPPTPVFWPGESHGQRSLGATVPGVAESDTTEVTEWVCTVVLILGTFDKSPICPGSVSQGFALLQGWVLLSSSLIFFLKNRSWNFTGPCLHVLSPQDPSPSAHPCVG